MLRDGEKRSKRHETAVADETQGSKTVSKCLSVHRLNHVVPGVLVSGTLPFFFRRKSSRVFCLTAGIPRPSQQHISACSAAASGLLPVLCALARLTWFRVRSPPSDGTSWLNKGSGVVPLFGCCGQLDGASGLSALAAVWLLFFSNFRRSEPRETLIAEAESARFRVCRHYCTTSKKTTPARINHRHW